MKKPADGALAVCGEQVGDDALLVTFSAGARPRYGIPATRFALTIFARVPDEIVKDAESEGTNFLDEVRNFGRKSRFEDTNLF